MCHSSWPRCIILRAFFHFSLALYESGSRSTGRHGITEPPSRSGQERNMVSDINNTFKAPVILIAWHSSFFIILEFMDRTEIPWPRGNWSHSLAESANGIIVPIMGGDHQAHWLTLSEDLHSSRLLLTPLQFMQFMRMEVCGIFSLKYEDKNKVDSISASEFLWGVSFQYAGVLSAMLMNKGLVLYSHPC